MVWISMGLGSVASVVILRVLLRQVRGLLLDIGDVVRSWTEALSNIDGGKGQRVGCCAGRYRRPGAVEAPRCSHRRS